MLNLTQHIGVLKVKHRLGEINKKLF